MENLISNHFQFFSGFKIIQKQIIYSLQKVKSFSIFGGIY